MFDKLYSAFAGVAKSLSEKELKESDIDDVLFELEIALLESDVASEVTDAIKADLKSGLIGTKVEKSKIAEVVKTNLITSISSLFDAAGTLDLLGRINAKKENGEPFLILFVGINGTGKTTSLAKVAHMLQKSKYSVVVAASDTFRAGAIEQLREHMKRLNVKLVAQNYNSDPAAVARDAVLYAKAHRTDCVLIDTAGRMQTSKNLMEQIAKITKVVNPDVKIFVGDSLAGNDTVNQAREFFEHTKFDASILTKADADARGGAALSIVKVTSTPVIYVGTGQEYADLRPFDKETFLNIVFKGASENDNNIKNKKKKTAEASTAVEQESNAQSVQDTHKEPESAEINNSVESQEHGHGEKKDDDITQQAKNKSQKEDKGKTTQLIEAEILPKQQHTGGGNENKPTEYGAGDTASKQTDAEPQSTGQGTVDSKQEQVRPSDPFEGIADADITMYSDIFDVSPPENDSEAKAMAEKIRMWVTKGRPDVDIDSSADDVQMQQQREQPQVHDEAPVEDDVKAPQQEIQEQEQPQVHDEAPVEDDVKAPQQEIQEQEQPQVHDEAPVEDDVKAPQQEIQEQEQPQVHDEAPVEDDVKAPQQEIQEQEQPQVHDEAPVEDDVKASQQEIQQDEQHEHDDRGEGEDTTKDTDDEKADSQGTESEDNKKESPKKKRGIFGRFRWGK